MNGIFAKNTERIVWIQRTSLYNQTPIYLCVQSKYRRDRHRLSWKALGHLWCVEIRYVCETYMRTQTIRQRRIYSILTRLGQANSTIPVSTIVRLVYYIVHGHATT